MFTWSPVDGPERPEHPEDTENLEETNTRASEDGNQRHRDDNNIETVECLKKNWINVF